MYLGTYFPGETVDFEFNTVDSNRALVAMAGSPALAVWKDGSATEFTTGLTLTEAFDTTAGFHKVAIVTTNATYASGSSFTVGFTAGTVDGVAVTKRKLCSFRIQEWPGVIRRGTASAADTNTITLAAEAAPSVNFFAGNLVQLIGATTGKDQTGYVASSTAANPPVITYDQALATSPTGTVTYLIWAGARGLTVAQIQAGLAVPGDAMTLSAQERADTVDKLLGRTLTGGADGGRTVSQALARIRNKITVNRTTGAFTVYDIDDTASLWTGTATFITADDQVLQTVDPA